VICPPWRRDAPATLPQSVAGLKYLPGAPINEVAVMEINTILSTLGVNGAATPSRSTPASKMLSDGLSLTNSSALEQSLENAPASRSEVVDRAKTLIADPAYPSGQTLAAVSLRLASGLMSEDQ